MLLDIIKRALIAFLSLVCTFLLDTRIKELLSMTSNRWLHELVFEPFSVFIVVFLYIICIISLAKLCFLLSFSTVSKLEQIFYTMGIIFLLIKFQWLFLAIVLISLIYFLLDVKEYNYKVKRLK
ncbi:hypothetical protein LGQ02_08355 [Bacillus shivajii]|uniref:hypothetical protein n=1 Tax=Bacillus shivajii TaxID=1983719 RepID=UPI001CFB0B14|nr:hypothetical protein [Bacillus shivajii]UCZ54741.1 hypothetical protein LGQ02_08355 [Bacillus shivajii]